MSNTINFFTPSESQIIKAISIIAVILLHGLTLFPSTVYFDSNYKYLIVLFDQFLRFCVPTFVFISGYGLARKFLFKKFSLWNHLNKWLLLTIPIYLLWTVYFIWILNWYAPWGGKGIETSWLSTILKGEADYHLYFIPMLLQLYLIFPIIWKFFRHKLALITLLAFGIQLYSYYWYQIQDYGDQFQYLMFTSWIGYFCLGIWFGINQPKKLNRLLIRFFLVASLIFLITNGFMLLEETKNIVLSMRTTKPLVILYSFVFLYALTTRSIRFSRFQAFQILGEYSLILYFSHTLVIRFIKTPFNSIEITIVGLLSFLAMIIVSVWWHKNSSKLRL